MAQVGHGFCTYYSVNCFIPILIMQLEVYQFLTQDIAVAISVAVLMSLLVSVTILPALTGWILKNEHSKFLDIKAFKKIGKLVQPDNYYVEKD